MNADIVSHVFQFCDKNAFLYQATINKTWRHVHKTCTTSICQAVASQSRVASVLETLRTDHGLNDAAFYHAAKNGQISVLDRLLANKRSVALYTCTAGAVAGGNLAALEWAFSNGFLIDRFVCHVAASKGNLDILAWALDNGCPCDLNVAF